MKRDWRDTKGLEPTSESWGRQGPLAPAVSEPRDSSGEPLLAPSPGPLLLETFPTLLGAFPHILGVNPLRGHGLSVELWEQAFVSPWGWG